MSYNFRISESTSSETTLQTPPPVAIGERVRLGRIVGQGSAKTRRRVGATVMYPPRDNLRPALAVVAVYAVACLVFAERWVEAKARECTSCPPAISIDWLLIALALVGAAVGFSKLRGRRRLQNPLLRTVAIAFTLALLMRGWDDFAYGINFEVTGQTPYPSISDVAYVTEALLWVLGALLLYWALDTTPLEEMHASVDILVAIWGFTVIAITLIRGEGKVPSDLGKLTLDIFYPFAATASCALVSALVFGPQLRRMTLPWRWCVVVLYVATLIQMIASLAYSLLSSLNPTHPALDEFFWEGGPVDFLYATAVFLFAL